MCGSGIDDFAAADDVTLWDGMREAARLGLPVAVHAESDALTTALAARAISGGRTSMRDFLASRPVVAELEAIARALLLAEDAGCCRCTSYTSRAAAESPWSPRRAPAGSTSPARHARTTWC